MTQKSLAIRKTLRWLFLALIAFSAVEYMFGSVGRLRNMLGEGNLPPREMIQWPKRTQAKPTRNLESQSHALEESQKEPFGINLEYNTLNSSNKEVQMLPEIESHDISLAIKFKMNIENMTAFNEAVEPARISNGTNSSRIAKPDDESPHVIIPTGDIGELGKFNDTKDVENNRTLKIEVIRRMKISKFGKYVNEGMRTLKTCPEVPPNLVGELQPKLEHVTLKSLEHKYPQVRRGGWYRPNNCRPRDKVAIIVPFRNREPHLGVFLNNLHPFLMKQQLEYGIFIIEQDEDNLEFNRGTLFNIGFVEAQNAKKATNRGKGWDCFIFHDVDLIPFDDRNIYKCPRQPRHMSAGIDKFDFKLSYQTLFGGVSAMTTEQFTKVNGFSNKFWGWGGEDDEMSGRLRYHGYHIARYPMTIARYTMLQHKKEKANPKRYEIMVKNQNKSSLDGLSTLRYTVKEKKFNSLYTWYLVRLNKPS